MKEQKMSTYWVTFRIHDQTIGGRTYEKRYSDFVDAVRNQATMWWTKPTSFICFASNNDIDAICSSIKGQLAPAYDLFLIGMPDYKSARIWGANDDDDIYKLIPFLKKA